MVFGGGPMQAEVQEFEALVHEACCGPLLAGTWAQADMGSVRDHEHFFLFEEMLRWVGVPRAQHCCWS
jgi:hypothetical protein